MDQPTVVSGDRVETVVGILVASFYADPLWSWAFPDADRRREQHRRFWRLLVEGAVRYPWTWLTAGESATSVWIPPDGSELSTEQEALLEPLLRELLGPGAERVVETLALFEASHPRSVPHYYLSLLGTDPAQAGHGHGLGLLSDNLGTIDAQGLPAYLEASNPANVPLYRRYGFEVVGSFQPPEGAPEVFTMWREPGAGG